MPALQAIIWSEFSCSRYQKYTHSDISWVTSTLRSGKLQVNLENEKLVSLSPEYNYFKTSLWTLWIISTKLSNSDVWNEATGVKAAPAPTWIDTTPGNIKCKFAMVSMWVGEIRHRQNCLKSSDRRPILSFCISGIQVFATLTGMYIAKHFFIIRVWNWIAPH